MLMLNFLPRKIRALFSDGLSYGLMKILGRFMVVRKFARNFNRKNSQLVNRHDGWFISDMDMLKKELKQKGFSLNISVENSVINNLKEYANKHQVHGHMNSAWNFYIEDKDQFEKELNEEILIAHYPNLHESTLFRSIETNRVLQSIASFYCGANAKCIASQMWWTFPANVSEELRNRFAHFFHRDLDGYNFIKFFIYLTDVKSGDGGHFFIEGSHNPTIKDRLSEKFRINRISDEIIVKRYGKNKVIEMIGEAGTVIVEDTFGLHKGQTPSREPRLLACFVFGTKDYKNIQRYIV